LCQWPRSSDGPASELRPSNEPDLTLTPRGTKRDLGSLKQQISAWYNHHDDSPQFRVSAGQ
jgi:hypothetical protein